MNNYQNSFDQLVELKNSTIKGLHVDFMKLILSVSVVMIPLISFFLPETSAGTILFRCLLISLLVCILSGVVYLYIILIQHRKLALDLNAEILRSMESGKKVDPVFSKYNKALKWSEYISVLSFFASIILNVMICW